MRFLTATLIVFLTSAALAGGAGGGGGGDRPGRINWNPGEGDRAWISPDELDRQSQQQQQDQGQDSAESNGSVASYPGCYTTYQSYRKANSQCPPGVVAVFINGWGRSGYTCQCAIDTDRGGN